MDHVIDTAFGLVVASQAISGWRWLWRRYLLRRAPMCHDMLDAMSWSRLHDGELARFPGGDVSLEVGRRGQAKLVVNREPAASGLG